MTKSNKGILSNSSKEKDKLKIKNKKKSKEYDNNEDIAILNLLASYNLEVKKMASDGNCMFRSISDQLFGDQGDHHIDIRHEVMDYFNKNKDYFSNFIEDDEPFDTYINRMKMDGEWGGNCELYAASQFYRVNIFIHQFSPPRYIIQCEKATKDIHLSYHGECHYNSVRSKSDPCRYGESPLAIDSSIFDSDEVNNDKINNKITEIKRICSWMNIEDKFISIALKTCNYNINDTIEFLSSNPSFENDESFEETSPIIFKDDIDELTKNISKLKVETHKTRKRIKLPHVKNLSKKVWNQNDELHVFSFLMIGTA